ncbi:MAG: hypothetical protein WCJ75_16180, partial [Desulfomonile sp.]
RYRPGNALRRFIAAVVREIKQGLSMRPQPRRHRCTPHGLAHPDDPELQYQDAVIRNLEIMG